MRPLRTALAVGRKEFLQIGRDRRTLMILLFVPAFFLLLYGYALSFDVRNVPLAIQDNDRSPASRAVVSAFVNSGYFDLVADVTSNDALVDLIDRNVARAVVVVPAGFDRDARTGRPTSVQLIVDGDNANTATTVVGYGLSIVNTISARYEVEARAGATDGPLLVVEPRIWYNPELRSALFLVPGLIAYIAMLTAVVSAALSIVREKEAGTMEQIRMSPIGPASYVLGKTIPYFFVSLASAMVILLLAMVFFGLPMRGSWMTAARGHLPVPGGRARVGAVRLDHCREPAGGLPDRPAQLVPADTHAVGLHLPDLEHAGGPAGRDLHRAGPLLPGRPAGHRAEGRRRGRVLAGPAGAGPVRACRDGARVAAPEAAVGLRAD